MIKEEAIQWLTDIKENITENWSHDVAIDIAIESLSAEYEDYEHATLVDIKEPLKQSAEPTIDVNKLQTSAEQNIANGEVSVSDMAGDLVSRKILIGAIEKCGEEKIYPQALIETIKALPSAEPSLKAIKKQIDEHWYLDKNDLISRADVINAIENTDWYHNANGEMIQGATSYNAWYKAEDIYKALNELPSADRPKGEWEIEQDDDGIYGICSICGNDADFEHYRKPYNYCPNCGADMRGEK